MYQLYSTTSLKCRNGKLETLFIIYEGGLWFHCTWFRGNVFSDLEKFGCNSSRVHQIQAFEHCFWTSQKLWQIDSCPGVYIRKKKMCTSCYDALSYTYIGKCKRIVSHPLKWEYKIGTSVFLNSILYIVGELAILLW